MDIHARPVLIYRWIVFLLAGGYALYQIWTSSYEVYGGPFRFLTIWALLASFFAASRMLALSERRTQRQWEAVVGATAALNAMVVILYWRLYFTDPALVNNGTPVWHQEYYLHLVGPLLQWIDMAVVYRRFRRYLPAAVVLITVTVTYILWTEVIVAPRSNLPYPFLNQMTLDERLIYYATVAGSALFVLAVAWGVAAGGRALLGQSSGSAKSAGNPSR